MQLPKIILKKGKESATKRFHHWVFSGAIQKIEGKVSDGDLVRLHSSEGKFLAIGHYQLAGSISVRIISFDNEPIDHKFWVSKFSKAFEFRRKLKFPSGKTNCFRLIHGEGDGLPGLVLDYYDGVVVMLCYTMGMYKLRHDIANALKEVIGDRLRTVYYKATPLPATPTGDPGVEEYLIGDPVAQTEVLEYENKFIINWEEGQKSGFFLDQRENRRIVGEVVKNKSVLNAYCYSGGFSIYALQNEAKKVVSVDISEKAIELTDKNVAANFSDASHISVVSDVLDFLKKDEETFDVIILDPPAFAKHQNARHNAVQGYRRINHEALKKINKGGFLFTFSCSQVVDKVLFANTVKAAAIDAGRPVKIIKFLSQPEDHPVNIFHPETEYLKGLCLYVE
ncbi:MAG: class I SAM-dependent rRNA methyltransferase [Candidatus Cyclobacteriaceae bacterium M2_1C_046]